MIQTFVDRFIDAKPKLAEAFKAKTPSDYSEIVKAVIEVIRGDSEYDSPDPERIHRIDDGDYQGTLVFVVAAGGYQPSDYWYVKVSYGSCSGCDTLEALRDYSDSPPSDSQIDGYVTLALHIVQGLKKMGDEE